MRRNSPCLSLEYPNGNHADSEPTGHPVFLFAGGWHSSSFFFSRHNYHTRLRAAERQRDIEGERKNRERSSFTAVIDTWPSFRGQG